MNPNCWRCGGAGSYSIAIITGNGEWTTAQKNCPDCAAPVVCVCGHAAEKHAPGYACAGLAAVTPGVAEWCQCDRYRPAPADSEESEAR